MAMIPAMTTGMTHFINRSGRSTAMAEIPTPDLAVPYLSLCQPTSSSLAFSLFQGRGTYAAPMQVKTMADVHPIAPKKGAYTGQSSAVVAMVNRSCTSADRSNVRPSQTSVRYPRNTCMTLQSTGELDGCAGLRGRLTCCGRLLEGESGSTEEE